MVCCCGICGLVSLHAYRVGVFINQIFALEEILNINSYMLLANKLVFFLYLLVECLLLCMLVWWLNAFILFPDARFERYQIGRGLPQECIRRSGTHWVLILRKEPRDIAIQGKPSKLVAYLILVLLIACFINVYKNAGFYIATTSKIAITSDLTPQVNWYHPYGWHPSWHLLIP
jgi:hypothetical protein